MSRSPYRIITAENDSSLRQENDHMAGLAWPEFMQHDPKEAYFNELYEYYPQHQFGLVDKASGEVMCIANSLPLAWSGDARQLPDEGWDWAIEKGIKDYEAGRQPSLLCAIQVMLPPRHRGKRLSGEAVQIMKEIGRQHGLSTMIAPVRPSAKSNYPLTDMTRYIEWRGDDGLPFDPWLRVHVRRGGRIVKVCPRAMCVTGCVAEWESWTEMRFPESGMYIVAGALSPVRIDCESDQGIYVEPNVWTLHE